MQNEFANARNVCWLNSASEGLLPLRSAKAIEEAVRLTQTPQLLDDSHYFDMPQRCRQLLAEMLHCSVSEIALLTSTSFGMTAIALSLPLNHGDEVLLVERDFPANNFSWEALRQNGIRL